MHLFNCLGVAGVFEVKVTCRSFRGPLVRAALAACPSGAQHLVPDLPL